MMMNIRLTPHAEREIVRRGIDRDAALEVIRLPEQIVEASGGRSVHQSRMPMGGKMYLIRAIVDVADVPPTVLTVYRTSKIAKYWRAGP